MMKKHGSKTKPAGPRATRVEDTTGSCRITCRLWRDQKLPFGDRFGTSSRKRRREFFIVLTQWGSLMIHILTLKTLIMALSGKIMTIFLDPSLLVLLYPQESLTTPDWWFDFIIIHHRNKKKGKYEFIFLVYYLACYVIRYIWKWEMLPILIEFSSSFLSLLLFDLFSSLFGVMFDFFIFVLMLDSSHEQTHMESRLKILKYK